MTLLGPALVSIMNDSNEYAESFGLYKHINSHLCAELVKSWWVEINVGLVFQEKHT